MKPSATKIAAILLILITLIPCHAESIKRFGGSSRKPKCPFYAEVVFRMEREGQSIFNDRTYVWYGDPSHYRLNLLNRPTQGCCACFVHDGTCVYLANADLKFPAQAKWSCYPAFWMSSNTLEMITQLGWKLKNPVFLGRESLQGLKVKHWVGQFGSRHSTADSTAHVWASTDPRFPLVLKVKINSPKSSIHWEITHLRLGQPIPSYMLTSQVYPRSGLPAQLMMPYKPLWVILLRTALLLLSVLWLISALMKKKSNGKALSLIGAIVAVSIVLWLSPLTNQYLNQLSGLPVLFLIGGMIAIAIFYSAKHFPLPGNIQLFAGTRWSVAIWTLVAAGVGLTLRATHGHLQNLSKSVLGLPFLPETLVTVIVYAAIWAALEEVLFRGYITGLFKRRFSSLLVVNLLQSLTFVIWHIPGRIHTIRPSLISIGGFLGILVLGLIFGQFRLKYGNLAAPWLVHTGYNIGVFYAMHAGAYSLLKAAGF